MYLIFRNISINFIFSKGCDLPTNFGATTWFWQFYYVTQSGYGSTKYFEERHGKVVQ